VDTGNPDPIYVIGHRNPDTDAICSAIGYAAYLKASRGVDARAARCGEISVRTAWVLNSAGADLPPLVLDVRPNALSVCQRDVLTARPEETFLSVYRKLIEHNFRSIPVVDERNRIIGVPSLQELAQMFLPAADGDHNANRHVRTCEANMLASLEGAFSTDRDPSTSVQNLLLMVAASSLETSQNRLESFPDDMVVVLVGDRPDVQKMAILGGAHCLVVTGDTQIQDDIRALSLEHEVPIIQTRYDTASAAQLVRFSRPIGDALHNDFMRFNSQTPLKEIIATVHDAQQSLFPVVDEETGCLLGVFSKSDLVDAPRKKMVMVDHNEFSQAVTGADEADILEVIDHHRLSGNLRSKEPIRYINEPVGSTCTIVAMMYRMRNMEPDKTIATCLCGGMISDTLNLTSPTTTNTDRQYLPWLAEIAGLNVDQFTTDFFSAGSSLRDNPPEAALESDRKEFEENGWRISISQIEELGLSELWKKEAALHESLVTLCAARQMHFACLLVTDISRHDSVLLTAGDPKLIAAIEYPQLKPHVFELKGVVSRKKQLFPYLSRVVSKIVPA